MSVLDQVRFIVYRINKKGLEVFLINNADDLENWSFPSGQLKEIDGREIDVISLNESASFAQNKDVKVYAIEGDWHDIPSIRAIIKQDVRIVKNQLKSRIPELEQGAFFAVKEAFKKVLPNEYAMLKELKDILTDRNQAKYI